MKFKVSREHFSNGLQQVLNVVSSKVTSPVLNNVLLKVEKNYIQLTTTNLDLGISCTILADAEETGSITLPVKKLFTIIKSLPNKDIYFESTSEELIKITSGGSLFRVMGINSSEFPPLPSSENLGAFAFKQDELLKMLKSIVYAQSTDINRHILNGIYFNFEENKLTIVATDGRRLALTSKEMKTAENKQGSFILPGKSANELIRLLGQGDSVQLAFTDRQVFFDIDVKKSEENGLQGSIEMVSKVLEGKYPNYELVIPKQNESRIRVERELLQDCVQRAALVASEKNNSVRVKISNNLVEVSASSPEYGEAKESFAVAFDTEKEVQVEFNPQFLMDPLKALDKDEVIFEFNDGLSPGVLTTQPQANDKFLCVIMPVRR